MATKTKVRKPTEAEIEAIVRKPYTVDVIYGDDPEEGVAAGIVEWPGCLTAGDTREEALAHLHDAMYDWVEARLAWGLDIPEPSANYGGAVLVRMPRSLHRDAVRRAGREGVSLNQWLSTTIARAIGPAEGPEIAETRRAYRAATRSVPARRSGTGRASSGLTPSAR